ncbi:MAG: S-adenosylmethionine:tRNA ribosyltransferase-isomerase [Deltaproteobacteria bacterium]|nr:S-adenosylmethionine:tRNA ribosyltransferase-isomerase [Deltaproteobacteria bacterium]
MLVVDPSNGCAEHARVAALPRYLRAGDLLVVNDAATIPASLRGETMGGEPLEVRLLSRRDDGTWRVVLFGRGDWRTRTEDRPAPPELAIGARLRVGGEVAEVASVSARSVRLVDLRFSAPSSSVWRAIYRAGAPVQYAYVRDALHLWDVQTAYAGEPLAVEMPSAGRPLSWSVLLELRRRGVALACVTHAAGLSSTGDEALDEALPLDEELVVSAATVRAVKETRARGGRVVAVGTSVVRALEGNAHAHRGELVATRMRTSLRIGPGFVPRIVSGLLSGVHERGTSHLDLVSAFVDGATLDEAYRSAEHEGYRIHELGDVCLVLDGALASDRAGLRPRSASVPAGLAEPLLRGASCAR